MKASKYILALGLGIALTSCADDFLDKTNTYQLSKETFYDSDSALYSATAALYSYVWYDFNDKFYYGMGDGRANNITAQYSNYIYPYTNFTEGAASAGLTEAWGALYSVVSQANNVINNITDYASSSVSTAAKERAIGEARYMRGVAYWYIASLWGTGIVYTNTDSLVNNYVVKPQPGVDVMLFAARDLEYAALNLPTSWSANQKGRVTKFSAYGMLSRLYLSLAGLTVSGEFKGTAKNSDNVASNFDRGSRNEYYLNLAKKAAWVVIEEGSKYGVKLVDSYADLFSTDLSKFNNNSEVLFQLQFMTGSGVGGAGQSMTRFLAWSAMVTDTNAWGGATYCSYDLFKEFSAYEDPTLGYVVDDKIRRHNCVASYGEVYPELGNYTYGVDESAGNQGANVKKYVNGPNKVNGYSVVNNSGLNTYMQRLAEVYLNYTEACLGNGQTTTETKYFNMLRDRAGVPEKQEVTFRDILHERRMEFAFEGLYWYDLLRWSYFQEAEVLAYVNNQYRNASYYTSSTHTYELPDDYTPSSSVSTAYALNLTLPMADTDQTKNPYLKPTSATQDKVRQYDTVPYDFGTQAYSSDSIFQSYNTVMP